MPTTLPAHFAALASVLLVSACFLLAACDVSGSPSASASGTPTGAGCTAEEVAAGGIDGRVVDPDGNPLNDILIQIRSTGGFQGTARTGEDGVFSAPGVSGEFQVTTTDLNYLELVREITVPCGEMVEVELVLSPVDG